MGTISIIGVLFSILIIALIILFFVSLFSYIKRRVSHTTEQSEQIEQLNKKLDTVIDLLEESTKRE